MTSDKLNELSIFALRELARRTGVSSPTSKKKEQLIHDIIEINEGRMSAETRKTKQGRPPKTFGLIDELVFPQIDESSRTLVFSQERNEYTYEDFTTVAGFIGFLNNTALLYVQDNLKYSYYIILPELVNEYELRAGDRVVGEVNSKDNQKIIDKIFNINACPIMQYVKGRKSYENINHQDSKKCVNFVDKLKNFGVKYGENIYIYGSNNALNTQISLDLLNSCQEERKIYVNISTTEKNKSKFVENKNIENFITNVIDEKTLKKQIVSLAIERCKRLLENKENAVVVVDDILSVTAIDDEDLTLTKQLVTLSKNGVNSGSITMFSIMPTHKDIDAIEKLCDRRFKVESDKEIKEI